MKLIMENWKRFLNEGFPQPDPDYDYEYKRRSGRADSGPRSSLVQDPQYKEARKIYVTNPGIQDARKRYMGLPYGDPQEEEVREALLAAIQQAVEGDEDLFAQVVAQMEEEASLAR
tara:strand:+ start:877 stop:1224 length:348 start_codon:yes stop_codon:yes gene_type:complete